MGAGPARLPTRTLPSSLPGSQRREMEGAKFLTGDDQAWNRDYYHTMDTLPAGY